MDLIHKAKRKFIKSILVNRLFKVIRLAVTVNKFKRIVLLIKQYGKKLPKIRYLVQKCYARVKQVKYRRKFLYLKSLVIKV